MVGFKHDVPHTARPDMHSLKKFSANALALVRVTEALGGVNVRPASEGVRE